MLCSNNQNQKLPAFLTIKEALNDEICFFVLPKWLKCAVFFIDNYDCINIIFFINNNSNKFATIDIINSF